MVHIMERTHIFKDRTNAHSKFVVISKAARVYSVASPSRFIFLVSRVVVAIFMTCLVFQKLFIVAINISVYNI